MPAQQLDTGKSRISALSNNPSSQALVRSTDDTTYKELEPNMKGSGVPVFIQNSSQDSGINTPTRKTPNYITRTQWITVAILTYVNLINYMDRYTIAGILRQVQDEYQINDSQAGALQTAFVICYMLFAPLFGYLGDRHSRKMIMAVGVLIWVAATLIGSFMTDYYSFLAMRAIVGIGEASYSTIAPTIISDMFVKEARSKMLAIFYFAIPVGSGLGYVVGRGLANLFDGDWHWALRGTPILGAIAVILIVLVMQEPPRGEAEGHDQLKATDYKKDLKSLVTNMSFVFSTLGFTCVSFCTGALAWWGPKYIEDAIYSMEVTEENRPIAVDSIPMGFGAEVAIAGFLGVGLGGFLSTLLRNKYERSDPVIAGTGLVLSAPVLLTALLLARENPILSMVLVFFAMIGINLNWAIVADITLYVVVPTRRGTAEALQILISHLLGDAGSPYLIGVISESLKNGTISQEEYCKDLTDGEFYLNSTSSTRCEVYVSYYSMQYALIGNVIVEVLGGIFFFIAAIFVIKDRLRVHEYLAKHSGDRRHHEKDVMMNVEGDTDSDDEEQIPQLVAPNRLGGGKDKPIIFTHTFKSLEESSNLHV